MANLDDSADGSSRSQGGRIAALVTLGLLGASVVGLVTTVVDPVIAVGAVAVLAGLVAVRRWRRVGPSDRSSADDAAGERARNDDSSVWNAIPPWQYDGQHVEAGGMTRDEQERALRDVQQQADDLAEESPRT